MYDLEKLSMIMDEIEMYIARLERIGINSKEDLNDLKFDASSMICFSMLNKVIDLAEEIVKERDLGTPFKYRDLFKMLNSVKIIDEKMAEEIGDMIILRNKFAHRYGKITEKELLEFIKNIEKIKDFVKCIKEEVKK